MKKRHIFDVLWTVLGAVSARFGSLVLSVWVARETGKDNFALVGIYYATAMLGLVFFNAGVSNLTTKYLAEYLLKEPSKIKSILSATYLGCIFGGVVFSTGIALIAYFFSDKLFTSDRALFAMYFAAAAIFFMAVISGQSAILSGYGNFTLRSLSMLRHKHTMRIIALRDSSPLIYLNNRNITCIGRLCMKRIYNLTPFNK